MVAQDDGNHTPSIGAPRSSVFSQRLRKFGSEAFNRRMIGFTLCRAWVYISFFNAALLVAADDPHETLEFIYLVSLIALIATHLVCGWLNRRMERFFMTLFGQVFPPAITVIGSLLLLAAGGPGFTGTLAAFCSALFTGVGSGLILTCWGRIYSTTGGPTSAAECSLAFLLATMVVPFYALMPVPAQMALMAILPIGSALLLVPEFRPLNHGFYLNDKGQVADTRSTSMEAGTDSDHRSGSNGGGHAILLKLTFSSLIFGSIVGVVRTLYSSRSPLFETFATNLVLPLAALIAAAIVIGILLFARRLDMAFTYRPVLIFMTISCLALPLLEGSYFLSYVLTMAGYFCYEILNWVMLTDITYRHRMSAYRVYSFGRAAVSGGILVGQFASLFMSSYPEGMPTQMLYGISLGFVLLMIITYTLTLTERDVARVTRMESRPFKLPAKALADAEPETPAAGTSAEAEEEPRELSLEEKVQLLALRNDISGRAYDVLLLMAKGRTAARIEQELYVSRGTVNTYSHKVYQKLGIHSRQELFDLVDSVKDE